MQLVATAPRTPELVREILIQLRSARFAERPKKELNPKQARRIYKRRLERVAIALRTRNASLD